VHARLLRRSRAECQPGSLEIVQMMVERGTDPQAAINRAVSMRQPAAVEYLVAAKADMLSLRIAF